MEYKYKACFEGKNFPVAHGTIEADSKSDAEKMLFGICGSWKDENGNVFDAGCPVDVEVEEEENKIKKAIEEFKALQSREINPAGTFDNAGRWYPADSEKAECCEGLRSPSRAYPYSLMVHCRTLKHVCTKYGLDYREVKKAMNAEKPKRKITKKIMWKKVAVIGEEWQSVYSGEKYEKGRTYIEKVKEYHRGGYYCYSTKKEAEMAVFPDSSVNVDAEKIVVQVEVWGRSIEYENGKHAFTYMKFVQ